MAGVTTEGVRRLPRRALLKRLALLGQETRIRRLPRQVAAAVRPRVKG